MEMRAIAIGLLLFASFLNIVSASEFKAASQPTTEIVASAVDDIGSKSATRPVEVLENNKAKSQERYHLSDALNELPGVEARLEGSPLLSIRGSQSSARVLALQDGIPLNFGDGLGFNPLFVAKENIDSVALLKGPASSLFGRDAMAGAIEFRSETLAAPKFFAGQGSFGTNQLYAATPIVTSKTVSAQVTAYQTHSDGNFEYTIPRTGGTAVRTRNDSEILRSTILASGETDSLRWKTYHLIARQIGSTPDSIYSNMPSTFNNWGEMSYLGGEADLGDHLTFVDRSSFKTLTLNSASSLFPNSNSLTTSFRQGESLITKWGDASLEILDDTSWENFQASYYTVAQPLTINEVGAKGLYITDSKLAIQPAIRTSTQNGSLAPSFGVSKVTESEWKYFANYSEGYSPPAVSQLYSISPGFNGNPNLLAEHSEEIDVGVEKTIEEFFVHVEAFGRQMQNLIQNVAIVSSSGLSTATPQNVGSARAYGLEFQGKMTSIVNSGLNLAYLQNRKTDVDGPVYLSPNLQASVFVEKVLGDYSLMLQDTQWTSYYDLNFSTGQQVQLNGWNTLDFFFKFGITKSWHGEVALLNILDQARELNVGYPEPQSSFTFTLIGYL